jgi:hypothetical protein
VFLLTDNSTTDAIFYRGNSTSCKLFELVLRLRQLEMAGDLILHVVHVTGTRMIEAGPAGGSHGDFNQGMMAGESALQFIPLYLTALERAPKLEEWIRSWWNSELGELQSLMSEGWFTQGHGEGACLWAPQPAAADVVAEELGEARLKRPHVMHVVVVPRLMPGRWRKDLIKETYFWTGITPGTSFWPREMHEPLTVFVVSPLCRFQPWSW